jgi:hypothetical protein
VATRAFSASDNGERRDFNKYDIIHSISNTVPLANIASRQIEELKQCAAQARARTTSIDLALSEDLKKRSAEYGSGSIEVD